MSAPEATPELSLREQLHAVIESHGWAEIRAITDAVRAEDIADAITRIDAEEAAVVLQHMDVILAAEVMVEMPTETARQIVKELPDEVLAAYLDILPMDDALDLHEELDEDRFEALLQVIPDEDAREIRRLLAYPEGSVGRLMTERYFWVAPGSTMNAILEDLRSASEDKYETVHDLYVLDEQRKPVGVMSLRRVLRLPPETVVQEVMNREPIVVEATEDEEVAARLMSRYGFFALPVVDSRGAMVGVFTGDDAQTILREAETEDVLAIGAVSGDAENYMSLNVFQLFKRRLPWLLALFVAETLTGQVMRHYGQASDGELNINPLMFFIPLLIGAGGNVGSQVTTTITRALALGEIERRDTWMVLGREFLVALMIGGTLGTLGFLRAYLPGPVGWGSGWDLSLIVALALPAICLWSASIASMLPIAARRLGIDPAVMSAPFITTFVDATGLIIYFEIALRIMR